MLTVTFILTEICPLLSQDEALLYNCIMKLCSKSIIQSVAQIITYGIVVFGINEVHLLFYIALSPVPD